MEYANRSEVTALILSGGAGTRAGGRDKGLIEHGGRALVDVMIERLRPQVAVIVVSANRNLAAYAQRGATVVADLRPQLLGPLAGIEAGLAVADSELLLTAPVDAPEFPDDLLDGLTKALHAAGPERGVAVAHDGERRQALFALYRRQAARDLLSDRLDAGLRAVWQFQDLLGATEVRFDCRGVSFANLNTPGTVD